MFVFDVAAAAAAAGVPAGGVIICHCLHLYGGVGNSSLSMPLATWAPAVHTDIQFESLPFSHILLGILANYDHTKRHSGGPAVWLDNNGQALGHVT